MLEKFLVLLERFVVAHELIAANSDKTETKRVAHGGDKPKPETKRVAHGGDKPKPDGAKVEKAAPKKASKPEPEDEDLEDDEPPVKKETKKKAAKPEVDLSELRAEIKMMAAAIVEEDDDQCTDEFDDMMDEYEVRNINKIHDEDVVEFHAELKKLVARYFEIKED